MSTTTIALVGHLGRQGYAVDDNRTAGTASSQSGAQAIKGNLTWVKNAVANGSMILRSILTNDTPNLCWVANDSGQTIIVYPFAGENMNGVANAGLSIANGSFALFSRVKANLDWRAAAIA